MHLLLAPVGARVVLVEAGEVAVVALVERLVADDRQAGLAELVEDQVEVCWARVSAEVKAMSKREAQRLEPAAGRARLVDALLGQVRVASSR